MNDADPALVELIRRAREGDRDALGQLLEAHRDYLRRIAQQQLDSRLNARIDASDVIQQTCLSVHKRIAEFDGDDVPQFVAWLRRMHENNIQNAVRDQLHTQKRDAGREESLGDRDANARQTTPSQRAMLGEDAARLAVALRELPDDERDALRLRYLEGRTLDEVSRQMGITKDALIWLMKRGMKQLRTLLDTN